MGHRQTHLRLHPRSPALHTREWERGGKKKKEPAKSLFQPGLSCASSGAEEFDPGKTFNLFLSQLVLPLLGLLTLARLISRRGLVALPDERAEG